MQDNALKALCDLFIVVACACELAQRWGGAATYEAYFVALLAFVTICCGVCCMVKMCRLSFHSATGRGAEPVAGSFVSRVLECLSGSAGEACAEVPKGRPEEYRLMRKFRALGVLSKVEQASLRTYFLDARAEMRAQKAQNASMSGGRAGANLEYGGNLVYTQKFFVASFPGIYEATWRKLTEGAHTFLVACACVFFQDAKGGVNGKHVQDDRGCRCDFCAECAPHQERPQIGTTFTNWKGEIEEGGWAGNKAPWGCLWMKVWESNVEVLAASGQRAVVVHQVAEEVDGKTGKPMGLGNAQRGEVQFLVDNNIPFYLYSIEEYQELIDMAKEGRAAPEWRRGKFSIEDGASQY